MKVDEKEVKIICENCKKIFNSGEFCNCDFTKRKWRIYEKVKIVKVGH